MISCPFGKWTKHWGELAGRTHAADLLTQVNPAQPQFCSVVKWARIVFSSADWAGVTTGVVDLSLTAATSIIFVTTKVLSWQTCFVTTNTSFVATKLCFSWQKFCGKFCCCCNKHNFVETKVLSGQVYFCHNKHVCCDKTCRLLWQKYACWDKTFVMTNTCLSWQAYFRCDKRHVLWWLLSQPNFCPNKNDPCGSSHQR